MEVPDLVCSDCDDDVYDEWYMVHDHIWPWPPTEPGAHNGPGMLCVGCLEARIGRRLTPDDFTDAPLNNVAAWQSPRLQNRLGGR